MTILNDLEHGVEEPSQNPTEEVPPTLNAETEADAEASNANVIVPKPRKAVSSRSSDDTAFLQYQNQRLVQKLDARKHELINLGTDVKKQKDRKFSYEDILIVANHLWNQLVNDLIMLGVLVGGQKYTLEALDSSTYSKDSITHSFSEDIFLFKLLEVDSSRNINNNAPQISEIRESLTLRHSRTSKLMKFLEDTMDSQKEAYETLAQSLTDNISTEDATTILSKINDLMKEETINLQEAMEFIHSKHNFYTDRIANYLENIHSDEAEMKHLGGELEEYIAELEESRRKLVNLKMKKDIALGGNYTVQNAIIGTLSPEKSTDRMRGLRESRDAIEEAKTLTSSRLSQIEDIREDIHNLSTQLQDLQKELEDDKHVLASRPYILINDQLQHWISEAERYKSLTDGFQADKFSFTKREKEIQVKMESLDSVKNELVKANAHIHDLELEIHNCMNEKNHLEIKKEETEQDLGRDDIKGEFKVMASALSKEMEMANSQINRWKDTTNEAISLREKGQSLSALLAEKEISHKNLTNKCDQQVTEIKSLKDIAEKLQVETLELQLFLDLYSQEGFDSRDLFEIKESERRAHLQAEILKNSIDEHNLELRVKSANETEAACQQRLSAAKSEIKELREKLDTSERSELELKEAIKLKDSEADSYIFEIETIGQAYEDMQSQMQRLLKQMTERDEYNIKLVSESVGTEQEQNILLSDKEALSKKLLNANTSLDSLVAKISNSEELMTVCVGEIRKWYEEEKRMGMRMESGRWELGDAEKEVKFAKAAVAACEKEKEHLQRKMEGVRVKVDEVVCERRKLDDEVEQLNKEIEEVKRESGEAAIEKLEAEIKECKGILKCGVCFDRPKDVIIMKCYHLFCNPCIQRNLEIRHRKCPRCATAFGQNDVRFVNM